MQTAWDEPEDGADDGAWDTPGDDPEDGGEWDDGTTDAPEEWDDGTTDAPEEWDDGTADVPEDGGETWDDGDGYDDGGDGTARVESSCWRECCGDYCCMRCVIQPELRNRSRFISLGFGFIFLSLWTTPRPKSQTPAVFRRRTSTIGATTVRTSCPSG